MNKLFSYPLLLALLIIRVSISCTEPKNEIILNENFDLNTRGWVQEDTEFHKLEIKNGYYHLKSIDSTLDRTSSRSLDKSYLFNLPKTYRINTSMEITQSKLDIPYCGLILESPSYEYEFRVYKNGKAEIEEYNYAKNKIKSYENIKTIKNDGDLKKIELEIKIDGWFFEFSVNNQKLGKGKLSAKTWDRLAPFTGKFTEIQIDYLNIE